MRWPRPSPPAARGTVLAARAAPQPAAAECHPRPARPGSGELQQKQPRVAGRRRSQPSNGTAAGGRQTVTNSGRCLLGWLTQPGSPPSNVPGLTTPAVPPRSSRAASPGSSLLEGFGPSPASGLSSIQGTIVAEASLAGAGGALVGTHARCPARSLVRLAR